PDRRPTLDLARCARDDASAVLPRRHRMGAGAAARVSDGAVRARADRRGGPHGDPARDARGAPDGALHRVVLSRCRARGARRRTGPRAAGAHRRGRYRGVPARRVVAAADLPDAALEHAAALRSVAPARVTPRAVAPLLALALLAPAPAAPLERTDRRAPR